MNPADEKRRGAEAANLLSHPLFKEACAEIERRLVSELAKADIDLKRAEYVRTLLVSHRKIQGYIEQMVKTGDMVLFEEARRQSLAQRVFSKVGY